MAVKSTSGLNGALEPQSGHNFRVDFASFSKNFATMLIGTTRAVHISCKYNDGTTFTLYNLCSKQNFALVQSTKRVARKEVVLGLAYSCNCGMMSNKQPEKPAWQ